MMILPNSALLCSSPKSLLCSPPKFSAPSLARPSRISFFTLQAVPAKRSQRKAAPIKSRPYKKKTGKVDLVVGLLFCNEENAGGIVWDFISPSNLGSRFRYGVSITGAPEKPAPTTTDEEKKKGVVEKKHAAAMLEQKVQLLNDLLRLKTVLELIRKKLCPSSVRVIVDSCHSSEIVKTIKEYVVEAAGCYEGADYFKRCHSEGIELYEKSVKKKEQKKKEDVRKKEQKEEEARKKKEQKEVEEEEKHEEKKEEKQEEKQDEFIHAQMQGIDILFWPSKAVKESTKRKVLKDWKGLLASGVRLR